MPVVQRAKSSPPSFETLWAGFEKIRKIQEETARQMKETDRKILESQKEVALERKETERLIKILTNQMGGLHNSFGELTEHLVGPGIVEKFNSLGYHFNGVADRGFKIIDDKGKLKTEIDILLENGDYIIAVEVKSDVKEADIEHHIKRIKILREYRNKNNDKRKIRGAIAGANFYSNIKELAISKGFYVFQQTGDTMKMDNPKGFKPKEW